jgi:PAS domain S-box-containing protein
MPETIFEELKRYVHFGPEDERALRDFLFEAAPQFQPIAELFYRRIKDHPEALAVFVNDAQVQRLKGTLCAWLELLFTGPWDEAYYERRARIGRVHVKISLPQRYMFGAMNLIRGALLELTEGSRRDPEARVVLQRALNKILDLDLAIMLESYGHAFVANVQHEERIERDDLARQLALSEARYDEIVETAEALISTSDHTGHIVLFNAKCEQLTGVSRAAARGRNWLEMFVLEPDRAAVARMQQQVIAGCPALSYEGPVQTAPRAQRRVRWHFTTLPGGSTPALCAIGIDVTNEYDFALRTRRAERLAALGTMAAGLAHEIRNPLNSAHLQLNVARRRLGRAKRNDNDNVIKAVELAEVEMKRLATLVQDFLQFARPQPLRLSQIDLRDTARAIVELVSPEAKAAGVRLQLESIASVPIEVDEERVKQVLLNLLRNAIEATGTNGFVAVRIRKVDGMGELTIEDDGPGWAADAPIFEPFFTTKDTGTGLGLAIVHRIVMDHGGTLDANSRPGRTTFTIKFPRAYQSASLDA